MQKPLNSPPAEFPYESKFVDVMGYKIHYVEEGSGKPILFIHGNPTSSYLYRNVIDSVAENTGRRCIALDLLGFGLSEKPVDITYDLKLFIDVVDGFIKALKIPFEVRDYQKEAFIYAIKKSRCLLLSPTASGKSLIVYLIARFNLIRLKNKKQNKVLIIVPTTSLVEQLTKDFKRTNETLQVLREQNNELKRNVNDLRETNEKLNEKAKQTEKRSENLLRLNQISEQKIKELEKTIEMNRKSSTTNQSEECAKLIEKIDYGQNTFDSDNCYGHHSSTNSRK